MHIGTALHAPNGFGSLASGTTYHLLSNRSDVSFTTMTWFYENKNVSVRPRHLPCRSDQAHSHAP